MENGHKAGYDPVYNRKAFATRYPKLRADSLNDAIEDMVGHEISEYLKQWGSSPALQEEEP